MKKDIPRTTLVAGAIGVVLGAASLQVAQEMTAAYWRPSQRDLTREAQMNAKEIDAQKRADVVYPTKTQP